MSEKIYDLGRQRGNVTKYLGEEIARALEAENSEGDLRQIQQLVFDGQVPRAIIGYAFRDGDTLEAMRSPIKHQLGLPDSVRYSSARGRIAGREDDYVLVLLNAENVIHGPFDKLRFWWTLRQLPVTHKFIYNEELNLD